MKNKSVKDEDVLELPKRGIYEATIKQDGEPVASALGRNLHAVKTTIAHYLTQYIHDDFKKIVIEIKEVEENEV